MNNFFFFYYDVETNTTVPVPVEDLDINDEQELEFIYDDKVRKIWHSGEEEWYFSIVDVCQVLTDSTDGRKYWNKLKQRLTAEGNETVTNSEKWIEERMHSIDIRKQLTAEWDRAGITEQQDYATLTNILTKTWSGKSIQEYKKLKGLHKENLRDNMTDMELTLNRLAELSLSIKRL